MLLLSLGSGFGSVEVLTINSLCTPSGVSRTIDSHEPDSEESVPLVHPCSLALAGLDLSNFLALSFFVMTLKDTVLVSSSVSKEDGDGTTPVNPNEALVAEIVSTG